MIEFNIPEDTFELEGTLWFDFNPNIVSLNSISGFQFENGFLIEKSELHTKFIGQRLQDESVLKAYLSPLISSFS